MSRARRNVLVALSAVVAFGGLVACVDIFHSTDAITACDVEPEAPGCDAGPGDAGAPDTSIPTEVDAADGAAPDLCSATPDDATALTKTVCATLSTCEHGLGGSSYGECYRAAMQAYDCAGFPNRKLVRGTPRYAFWACMRDAKTCAAVQACVSPKEPQRGCPGGGNVATACGSQNEARTSCPVELVPRPPGESCAAQGKTCVQLDPYLTKCLGTRRAACGVGSRCDGTSLVRCATLDDVDGSVDLGFRCDDRGGKACQDSVDGPACVPDGERCSTTGGATCLSGSVASACIAGKREQVSCGALGMKCVDAPGFLDPLDLCQPQVSNQTLCLEERCLTNAVISCVSGQPYELKCAGRGTCKTATIDGRPVAYCSDLPP